MNVAATVVDMAGEDGADADNAVKKARRAAEATQSGP